MQCWNAGNKRKANYLVPKAVEGKVEAWLIDRALYVTK